MLSKISRNDPCFCESGKKYKKCHSDIHPESRAAHLINLYVNIDNKIKDYQELTGHIPSCHKGCFNCCYENFSISEMEFEFIMREMKKWNQESVEQIFDRALDQCEKVKKDKPDTWSNLETLVEGKNEEIIREQFERHSTSLRNEFPCPLLDESTKACVIYESRPIVCRLYGTTHLKKSQHSSFELCEHIIDSIEHAKETPNGDDYSLLATKFTHLRAPSGKIAFHRPYPIYYWFKIFYDRTSQKRAQYNHYDSSANFDRPIEQADYFILKGFNCI